MFVMGKALIFNGKVDKTFTINERMMIKFEIDSLPRLLMEYSDERKCIEFLEQVRWNGKPVSPFDPSSKVYKCKNNYYYCKNTKRRFNVKTKWIMENTKLGLRTWIAILWLFSNHKLGYSSMQLSRDLGITQKTAWFVLQRLRFLMSGENGVTLENDVEMDETYVGGKNKNRHSSKKVKHAQGRGATKDKTPVFGMLERSTNKVVMKVVRDTTSKDLMPHITRHVEIGSNVYTDESLAYIKLGEVFVHDTVNHGEGLYAKKNGCTTNSVENLWSVMKRNLYNYVSVSKKHLQLYVDEHVFRRSTMKFTTSERFIYLVNNLSGRLRYKELIAEA